MAFDNQITPGLDPSLPGGGSGFSISITGSLSQTEYDVYDGDSSESTLTPSMVFHRKGLSSLFITSSSTTTRYVKKIELLIGGKVFCEIVFNSSNTWHFNENEVHNFDLYDNKAPEYNVTDFSSYNDNVIFHTSEDKYGKHIDYTTTFNNKVYFDTSGSKNIQVQITYNTIGFNNSSKYKN